MMTVIQIPNPLQHEESVDFIKRELENFNGSAYPCRLRFQISEGPINMHSIRVPLGIGWALEAMVSSASLFWKDKENPPPIFLDIGEEEWS